MLSATRTTGRVARPHSRRSAARGPGAALAPWLVVIACLSACVELPPGAAPSPERAGPSGAEGPPVALDREPTVVLVSLDGTTWNALRAARLPVIERLEARGARARLTPVFPTNTFPNHVSLVTGVAPERHGIVNNAFHDPERGDYDKSDDPSWLLAEPLWSRLARAGLVSASYHWVGSEGDWRGHGPRHWVPFDASTPELEKVERILAWLDLADPAERPRLVTAWFHGADGAGHRHGPDAPEVAASLRAQEPALARLVAGLEARGGADFATLLVVSDHGMAKVERRVDLGARLRTAGVSAESYGAGGFASLWIEGGEDAIRRGIEAARRAGLEAHRPARAPADLRVSHPRFGDVIVLAPPGVAITRSFAQRFAAGMHGYRPGVPTMEGIFLAWGRGVATGRDLGTVSALDVAPTVLSLLGRPVPDEIEGRALPLAAGGAGS